MSFSILLTSFWRTSLELGTTGRPAIPVLAFAMRARAPNDLRISVEGLVVVVWVMSSSGKRICNIGNITLHFRQTARNR